MAVKPIKDIVQGTSFDIEITHDPVKSIAGSSFKLALNMQENTEPELLIEHVVGSNPLDDATNGKAIITVTKEQTSLLAAGQYYASLYQLLGDNITVIFRTGTDNIGKVNVLTNLGAL